MLKKYSNYFLTSFLIFIVAFVIFKNNEINYSLKVLLSSFFICCFSILKILSKKEHVFSLNNMFYIFVLFFIGLAPALQYKKGSYFLGDNSKLTETDFITGNIIFIVCILIYSFTYQWLISKKIFKKNKTNINVTTVFSSKIILILSVLTLITVFSYFSFDLKQLSQRSFLFKNRANYTSSYLSIINVIRGVPMLLLIFYKLISKKNLKVEITLLVIIVLCNFPPGISRYKTAVIYLPLLLVYFRPILKKQVFALGFVTLFLSVFPYLNHFRHNSNLVPEKILDLGMFTEIHFDSYQNSVNVITNNIITNGNQLLGVALFFIPRSLWGDKAVGSGHVLADVLKHKGHSNVAVSYFAEGYINLGYVGVFLFTLFLAIINSFFDYRYWETNSNKAFQTLYLILIPFQFFVLRGSLITSVSNLIGYLVCIIILNFLLNLLSRHETTK
ncbi:hypothetical protein CXF54_05675 [Olleya sp. 1-3]|nr:O-antigen polymerase [Olleya sp. 1-3]PKG52042.1 hypothetical protein CXF54_05675 [Olleya sp. 1-3]